MSKEQHNQSPYRKYAKTRTFVMIVFISLLLGGVIHKCSENRKKTKAHQEQRSKDFADYIICNIRNSVQEDIKYADIINAAKEYNQDSMAYKTYFAQLRQDSIKYADAIFRDAIMINDLDNLQKKSVSFADALEYVNSQPAEYHIQKTEPYFHMDHDGFGGINVWTEYIPTDEVIIEPNNSPARIIKTNKMHLTKISLELATRRLGMPR